ncbi:hypothetical protein AWC38_SpisGene22159 [Stylophora pistillata]|uniref:Uncharacterized protein n=1 Tax=Stylophora pistillata TaxID=50429 RepID=A0A2B4RBX3_STYPI|nr:hypothetical protein AWC38_SpisGene22159 [Stylophora pistillata]
MSKDRSIENAANCRRNATMEWTEIHDTLLCCEDGTASKEALGEKERGRISCGIAVEDLTELETLIDEIIDREKLAEESRDSKGAPKKIEVGKETAEKMRKEAMEQFGETKKRSEAEGDQGKKTKQRRSGNDAVEFLKEKTEKEMSFEWKNLP